MDELDEKNDLLDSLKSIYREIRDMKDKYYKEAILDLIIELSNELEEKNQKQLEEWELERVEQEDEYWADQF